MLARWALSSSISSWSSSAHDPSYFLAWTQSDFGDFLDDDTRKKRNKKEGGERERKNRHEKFLLFSWNDYIEAVTINGSQKEEESDHPCVCVHFALNGALQASDFNHLAAVCSSSLVTLCKLFGNENQPTTRKTDALMTPQKKGKQVQRIFFLSFILQIPIIKVGESNRIKEFSFNGKRKPSFSISQK